MSPRPRFDPRTCTIRLSRPWPELEAELDAAFTRLNPAERVWMTPTDYVPAAPFFVEAAPKASADSPAAPEDLAARRTARLTSKPRVPKGRS